MKERHVTLTTYNKIENKEVNYNNVNLQYPIVSIRVKSKMVNLSDAIYSRREAKTHSFLSKPFPFVPHIIYIRSLPKLNGQAQSPTLVYSSHCARKLLTCASITTLVSGRAWGGRVIG